MIKGAIGSDNIHGETQFSYAVRNKNFLAYNETVWERKEESK
jgi:hypothetical protein